MNSTPDPQTDRPRALHLLEAADFLRDAHFRDGLSVQEAITALRHMADDADPMVGSLARDGFGLDEIAAMPEAALPVTVDRAAVLREAANIVRSMDSDYALQEAAEHLDGLAVEADEEREAQAHLDALVPIAEGAPLPDLDGAALYEKLTAMFSGPLPWPSDTRPDLVTLRERIAEDLYTHDHPEWRVPMVDSDTGPVYRERAVAVLDGLRRLAAETPGPETQGGDDTARLAKVARWVTSEPVTANTEFGNGYRACQRDIRDLIKGRFDYDPQPTAPAKEA